MSPRDGSCQKLRNCVYILLKLLSENYWLLFFWTQCTVSQKGTPTLSIVTLRKINGF